MLLLYNLIFVDIHTHDAALGSWSQEHLGSHLELLGPVEVSDEADSGFLIKTGQDKVNTVITR